MQDLVAPKLDDLSSQFELEGQAEHLVRMEPEKQDEIVAKKAKVK